MGEHYPEPDTWTRWAPGNRDDLADTRPASDKDQQFRPSATSSCSAPPTSPRRAPSGRQSDRTLVRCRRGGVNPKYTRPLERRSRRSLSVSPAQEPCPTCGALVVEELVAVGEHDRGGTIAEMEFGEDRAEVGLDGRLADVELLGDFCVGEAAADRT